MRIRPTRRELTARWRRLREAQRHAAPALQLPDKAGRLHAAGGGLTALAAFGTEGLEDFLKGDALQVGILAAGLVIVFGSRKKDWPGMVTVAGIALMGLAVMGLSSDSFAIGQYLGGWIWQDES